MLAISFALVMALSGTLFSDDEIAIRSLFMARQTAWKMGDVEALVKDFVSDCDHVDSKGEEIQGIDGLRQRYQKLIDSGSYKTAIMAQSVKKIRFIRQDVAFVDAIWSNNGVMGEDGKPVPSRKGKSIIILIKVGGIWKINSFRVFRIENDKP